MNDKKMNGQNEFQKKSQTKKYPQVTQDYILELNPAVDTGDTVRQINDLLKNSGVLLEVTKDEDKSYLRLSIALSKLRRNAGCKKSDARISRLARYAEMCQENRSMEEIMKELKISQATYYRYAKEMENKDKQE